MDCGRVQFHFALPFRCANPEPKLGGGSNLLQMNARLCDLTGNSGRITNSTNKISTKLKRNYQSNDAMQLAATAAFEAHESKVKVEGSVEETNA